RPASGCRVPPIACSSHQISMVAAAITTPVANAGKHENSRRSFSTPVMAASPMRASHVGVSSPEGSSALLYRVGKVTVRSARWFAFPARCLEPDSRLRVRFWHGPGGGGAGARPLSPSRLRGRGFNVLALANSVRVLGGDRLSGAAL